LMIGLIVFGLATIAAGLATNAAWLIVARAAQGVGAALVAPNSLAHLSASFPRAERGAALGVWSGASAIVGGAAPLLGGWLVDVASWPAVFWLGLPPALLALGLIAARVPESRAPLGGAPLDLPGAALAAAAFSAITGGLISAAAPSSALPPAWLLGAGALLLVAFVVVEARRATPMLPLALFRSRAFSAANLLTLLLYAALSATFFLLPFALVQAYGYSATATGALFLPFAIIMGCLSHWAGGLIDRRGARLPLVLGPLLIAAGLAWFTRPPGEAEVWLAFAPGMAVIGLGMAITAAPLTSVVMGSVPPAQAGIAAGINNSTARLAGLLGVAVAGLVALAVFSGAVRARVAALDVAAPIKTAVLAERRALGDARIPTDAGADGPALTAALRAALADAFRAVAGLGAGLAVAAALCALLLESRVPAASAADAPFVCEHLGQIALAPAASDGCLECLRSGQRWVHLRLCLACGHVGCCDASANQHATRHFRATGHAIIQSLAPGEAWRWCYLDEHVV
jgi:predicted MFS family arabinose efflux permease